MLCSIIYVSCSQVIQATVLTDNDENGSLCLSWAPDNFPCVNNSGGDVFIFILLLCLEDTYVLYRIIIALIWILQLNDPARSTPPNFFKKFIIKICADGTSLKRESGKFQVKYIQEQKSLQYE